MERFYIGNIPFTATEEEIRSFFVPAAINSVKIITDRDTGRPRGFAFITSKDIDGIIAKNGESMGGRTIVVDKAKKTAAADRQSEEVIR